MRDSSLRLQAGARLGGCRHLAPSCLRCRSWPSVIGIGRQCGRRARRPDVTITRSGGGPYANGASWTSGWVPTRISPQFADRGDRVRRPEGRAPDTDATCDGNTAQVGSVLVAATELRDVPATRCTRCPTPRSTSGGRNPRLQRAARSVFSTSARTRTTSPQPKSLLCAVHGPTHGRSDALHPPRRDPRRPARRSEPKRGRCGASTAPTSRHYRPRPPRVERSPTSSVWPSSGCGIVFLHAVDSPERGRRGATRPLVGVRPGAGLPWLGVLGVLLMRHRGVGSRRWRGRRGDADRDFHRVPPLRRHRDPDVPLDLGSTDTGADRVFRLVLAVAAGIVLLILVAVVVFLVTHGGRRSVIAGWQPGHR